MNSIEATTVLNLKVVTWSLGIFTAISFVLCCYLDGVHGMDE